MAFPLALAPQSVFLFDSWCRRDDPGFLSAAIEVLARDEAALDELEFYLPQLVYMVLGPESLLRQSLERFVLRLCHSSAQSALQLSWIVQAALEDNMRGLSSSHVVRCNHAARLLQLIEQSFVYGARVVRRESPSVLSRNVLQWHRSLRRGDTDQQASATLAAALDAYAWSAMEAGSAQGPALPTRSLLVASAPTLEGFLLKRCQRNCLGSWRCCGESWVRRWFVLRGSILFYYRARTDTRPRGVMALRQSRLVLRPAPSGDYISMTALFSSVTIRIRGEPHGRGDGQRLTHMWIRALRVGGGLMPIPGALASLTLRSYAAFTSPPTRAKDDTRGERALRMRPTGDILADAEELSMSQRCAWLYLRAQRNFVRSLAMASEALYTPGAIGCSGVRPGSQEAAARLRALLVELRPPPLAYLPLCAPLGRLTVVCHVLSSAGHVFLTRERASALVCLEVAPQGSKLSQLFEPVQGRSALAAELAAAIDAPNDSLSFRTASHRIQPVLSPPPLQRLRPLSTRGERGSVLNRVFGASWATKTRGIRTSSPYARVSGWSLVALLTKANDDVRQEVFVMQCVSIFASFFSSPLRLRPYRILATGPSSGLIEMVTNTLSIDRLKRLSGFPSLRTYFEAAYNGSGSAAFAAAQQSFACSLAAYSILCYVLAIKDRHNGNILLDRGGHMVHIDFGFVLGQSTKIGAISGEAAVPFKLTREMVMVLGGKGSPLYRETFVDLCTAAMAAARAHASTLISLCEITAYRSALPCFAAGGEAPVHQLRQRLMLDVPDSELRARVQGLIDRSYDHRGTAAYDLYQQMSNGIRS